MYLSCISAGELLEPVALGSDGESVALVAGCCLWRVHDMSVACPLGESVALVAGCCLWRVHDMSVACPLGESVALVARSDLRTGEEVCLTYRHEGNGQFPLQLRPHLGQPRVQSRLHLGPVSAGQLLLHYGFAEMICADQPCL